MGKFRSGILDNRILKTANYAPLNVCRGTIPKLAAVERKAPPLPTTTTDHKRDKLDKRKRRADRLNKDKNLRDDKQEEQVEERSYFYCYLILMVANTKTSFSANLL
jgi:hypothetical protein